MKLENDELRCKFTAWMQVVVKRAKIDYIRSLKRHYNEISIDDEKVLEKLRFEPINEIALDDGFEFDNELLASIQKTRLVLDRINEALTVLKKKPEDGERLYDLIYLTYITPEALNHNDILYRMNMSSRHYYRLREQAINIISIRLWSAPNKDVEFWLELISIMGDDNKKSK